ncbi:hypothetical protein D024_2466 [Vibrio parahaemolyticus 3259]|nr:hypothetical protein Vp2S01_2454 [Vibrio parahaemolyticus]EQM11888.1 hypothetical protein D024_2466 [Vibrio parahaemolyticus 3259]ETJ88629.1 hypothetical protein D041_3714 [Vibrio parahaemolyticus EKP-008]
MPWLAGNATILRTSDSRLEIVKKSEHSARFLSSELFIDALCY